MEIFDSQSEIYRSAIAYRMSFKENELEVSMGKKKVRCDAIPTKDTDKWFLEEAIANFIMFNPEALKAIETAMLNSLNKLSAKKNMDKKSEQLRGLFKWLENTRFNIMKTKLSEFSKSSLVDEGFESISTVQSYLETVSNRTGYEATSCFTDANDYHISIEENGIIKVKRIVRKGAFSSRILSTKPEWGEHLLTELDFRNAVALCIRLDPEKFYQIADKLKRFIHFNKDGRVTEISVHYFYLSFMASEEAKLKMAGKWKII